MIITNFVNKFLTYRIVIRNIAKMQKMNLAKTIIIVAISWILFGCTAYTGNSTTTQADPQINSDFAKTPTDPPVETSAQNIDMSGTWPSTTPAAVALDGNLWDDMQDYLQLPNYDFQPQVEEQIDWFKNHQGYLNKVIKQSAPYIYYIFEQTKERQLPAELALLPIIESGYNPFGTSFKGATGLWQMMPGTASGFGLKIDWWYDGRRDITASTKAALDYLSYLNDFFTNDWLLAIAAYDSGEGTVQNALRYNKNNGYNTDFWALHLPRETEDYIPKLLALSAIIRDPNRYGIYLMPINDAPYLKKVNISTQIDLSQAAKLADINITTLRELNPGFRRWATDPDGPYSLLIPVSKYKGFEERLNSLPSYSRVTWNFHIVSRGDTLSTIAKKYHTTTATIKQVNHLKNNTLHRNQRLLIPINYHGRLSSPIINEHTTISEEQLPGPHRVIHIVSRGETLQSVARKYNVSKQAIAFWNQLNVNNSLAVNQKLLIWASEHAKTETAPIKFYNYKVKSGDNLWTVAKRFKTTPATIKKYNKIKNNTLHVGHSIRIPEKVTAVHYRAVAPSKTTYIIRSGDTLDAIAKKYHTTKSDLMRWNNIRNTRDLHPGHKIQIYLNAHTTIKTTRAPIKTTAKTYVIKSGDTLDKIAHKFGTTTNNLKKWNHLENNKYLHLGQKIVVSRI